MARRRETNIFSLSLLDCICCGFGALILFHMIIASRSGQRYEKVTETLQAEVDKRQKEVLEGNERLVELRNSFREIEEKRAAAQGLSTRILETLKQIEAELATYDAQTVAQREHVNKLKADLKSLEEGTKRLSGGAPSQEVPGRNVRSFAGDGDRQYLTGLKVGGKRIFILADASSSMLADDIVNAVRRHLFPPQTRLRARKWRHAVRSVDWLAAQMPRESQFQLYVFNTRARPVLAGTDGVWLAAKDRATAGQGDRGPRPDRAGRGHEPVPRLRGGRGDEPAARQHHPAHRRAADAGGVGAEPEDRLRARSACATSTARSTRCRAACPSTSSSTPWRGTRWPRRPSGSWPWRAAAPS